MTAGYLPLQALLLTFAGWVNREQARTIEYLVEENRVLKEQFKGRKLRLTDDQRRCASRLAQGCRFATLREVRRTGAPGALLRSC